MSILISPHSHRRPPSNTFKSGKSSYTGYAKPRGFRRTGRLSISSLRPVIKHYLGYLLSFVKDHSMLSIVLTLIGSWLYLILVYMTYLLRGGQLGVFISLGVFMFLGYLIYLCVASQALGKSRLHYYHPSILRLSYVTMIACAGWFQSAYRTGMLWFVRPLLLAYVLLTYHRQKLLAIVGGLVLGLGYYMILTQTVLDKLNW